MKPRPELERFLAERFPDQRVEPVVGDASARRFFRLRPASGPTRIVMDYGAPFDGETDDERLTRIFRAADLPVAAVLDRSESVGCLVVEDLGDLTLEQAIAGGLPETRRVLYDRAVDLLQRIADRGSEALAASDRADGPALDSGRFRFEMGFFEEHLFGGLLGRSVDSSVMAALTRLADEAADGPRVLCHRDYHSRNLIVGADGSLAMVDIQDSQWGPAGYDLVSLLFDAYVDVPREQVERSLDRFGARPDPGSIEVLAAQRMIKALGTFAYQTVERENDRYAASALRLLGRLDGWQPKSEIVREVLVRLTGAGLFEASERFRAR